MSNQSKADTGETCHGPGRNELRAKQSVGAAGHLACTQTKAEHPRHASQTARNPLP